MADDSPDENKEIEPSKFLGEVPGVPSRPTTRGWLGTEFFLLGEAFVRALLAFAFVFIFAGTIWAAFRCVGGPNWKDAKELLELLLPAETALLGGAIGFYFGTRK